MHVNAHEPFRPALVGVWVSIHTLLMMEVPLGISSQAIKHHVMRRRTTGCMLEISEALDYFSHKPDF